MNDQDLQRHARALADRLLARGLMLACAESCTGGWVAKVCTDLPGSSKWFERGFVTYTNEAKQEMLGVPAEVIIANGAVSAPTVEAMARGALAHSRAQLSLAISGIAGPGGGCGEKPVGTVFHAWAIATDGEVRVSSGRYQYQGDREAVRRQAVVTALKVALDVFER